MDFGVVKFPNGSLQPFELQTHQQYFVELRPGDKTEDDLVEALKTAVTSSPTRSSHCFSRSWAGTERSGSSTSVRSLPASASILIGRHWNACPAAATPTMNSRLS